jgi:hypothetical protein
MWDRSRKMRYVHHLPPRDSLTVIQEYKPGTGMPDEQNYTSYLVTYEDAMERLGEVEKKVLRFAWAAYCQMIEFDAEEREREEAQQRKQRQQHRSVKRTSRTQVSDTTYLQAFPS